MQEINNIYTQGIPSEKITLLQELIGQAITSLIKYSFDTPEEYFDYLAMCEIEDKSLESAFKWNYGFLSVAFDNDTRFSFYSNEEINSVMVKLEYKDGTSDPKKIEDITSAKLSIDARDLNSNYSGLLYSPVEQINILTTLGLNAKELDLPSETGLELILQNGRKLILSHNLTKDSFVFTVLTERDNIPAETVILQTIE